MSKRSAKGRSGPPRSGTSLVMQILEAAGIPLRRPEGRGDRGGRREGRRVTGGATSKLGEATFWWPGALTREGNPIAVHDSIHR